MQALHLGQGAAQAVQGGRSRAVWQLPTPNASPVRSLTAAAPTISGWRAVGRQGCGARLRAGLRGAIGARGGRDLSSMSAWQAAGSAYTSYSERKLHVLTMRSGALGLQSCGALRTSRNIPRSICAAREPAKRLQRRLASRAAAYTPSGPVQRPTLNAKHQTVILAGRPAPQRPSSGRRRCRVSGAMAAPRPPPCRWHTSH